MYHTSYLLYNITSTSNTEIRAAELLELGPKWIFLEINFAGKKTKLLDDDQGL